MSIPSSSRIEPRTTGERKILIVSLVLLILLVALDQITKALVVANIPYHSYRPVIEGYFDISHITNKGAAWGMFHNSPWFPFGISIAAFIAIAVFFRKITDGWGERFICLAMIISGIIGNCTDRIARGAVIDFLRFHWKDAAEWPSFNIADSAIVCGVIIFALSSILRPQPVSKKKETAAPEPQTDANSADTPAANSDAVTTDQPGE